MLLLPQTVCLKVKKWPHKAAILFELVFSDYTRISCSYLEVELYLIHG